MADEDKTIAAKPVAAEEVTTESEAEKSNSLGIPTAEFVVSIWCLNYKTFGPQFMGHVIRTWIMFIAIKLSIIMGLIHTTSRLVGLAVIVVTIIHCMDYLLILDTITDYIY